MRWLAVLALVAMPVTEAAAEGRMGPDNPWFQHFEAACRRDGQKPPIAPECAQGVIMGWRTVSGTMGTCDFTRFWEAVDERKSDIFNVLPWQTAVEAIFREPGVCDAGV